MHTIMPNMIIIMPTIMPMITPISMHSMIGIMLTIMPGMPIIMFMSFTDKAASPRLRRKRSKRSDRRLEEQRLNSPRGRRSRRRALRHRHRLE